ncbi:hypothetical protein HWV62_15968 [Athelia sp. TMB]|nr:hypothetical protein HWV62_23028 [Athelia sp. TMB]KAF7984194.1 hypothetical protein HWV62_15968 [Athelia sp. TMB]
MADKGGAYGTKAADTDFRKKWDKEEYAEKARKKDEEEKDRMKENEERMKQGKKPIKARKKDDLPKPTELMKRREGSLELDKNLNKTMVVQNPGGRGPGQPGFYCEPCNRTYKDSVGYLDHVNSKAHLRVIGQTTRIERSTLEQVRARIAYLREKTKDASKAKSFDFDQRLAEVKAKEAAIRAEKKAKKQAEKEKARVELVQDTAMDQDDDMAKMMGFGGFGSSKK